MKTENALGLGLLAIVAAASVLYWGTNNSSSESVHRAVDAHHSAAASSSTQKKVLANLLPQILSAPHVETPAKFKTQHQIYTAPGDVAKEAAAEASASSPEAMRQLGQALLACAHADMSSDEEIEQKIAKRSIGHELLKGDSSIPNVAADAQEVDRLKRVRDSCKPLTKDEMAQGLTWLERSAEAGDSEARSKYAWTALDDFPTYESKEDNAEEYIRRRDLALGFLKDSIANGDCSNGILNGFRKATSDRFRITCIKVCSINTRFKIKTAESFRPMWLLENRLVWKRCWVTWPQPSPSTSVLRQKTPRVTFCKTTARLFSRT